MDERIFQGAKRACYAGLDSVTLRRTVAERVAPLVRYDGYAFGTTDPDTGLLSHIVAQGIPDRTMTTYVTQLYPYERVHVDARMARIGRPVFHRGSEPGRARRPLGADGFLYEVNVVFGVGGELWGKWCLKRAGTSATTDRRVDILLERLVPHLARGLRTAALLERGLCVGDSCDPDVPGIVVLDQRGRLTLRTDAAGAAFRDLADVGVAGPDHVPLAVCGLVAQLRAGRGGAGEPESLTVRARGRSTRWYSIRATLAEPDGAGECAAVVVVEPLAPRERASVLARLYGLSSREREIIAAIARGEPTKRIATALGVSPHTVAEHVNRACDKIGVRGRRALVARLFFGVYAPALDAERPRMVGGTRADRSSS